MPLSQRWMATDSKAAALDGREKQCDGCLVLVAPARQSVRHVSKGAISQSRSTEIHPYSSSEDLASRVSHHSSEPNLRV